MKHLAATVLVVVAVGCPPAAGEDDARVEVASAAEPCLNLRAAPSAAAERRDCLEPGTSGRVLESKPGWTRLRLPGGKEGWVSSRWIIWVRPPGTVVPRSTAPEPAPVDAIPRFEPPVGDLLVRRGDFSRRMLLTGELRAARSSPVLVPPTDAWSVQVRSLVADGTEVGPGDPLAELDSSELVSRLADLELSAIEAAERLARAEMEAETVAAEKVLSLERTRIALAKARVQAAVPEDILARRDYQERQLALRRAEVAHAKAREELDAHRRTTGAEVTIQRLDLEKAERQIARLERDLEDLNLRAPGHGIALVERHAWEDRKFAVGDTVWPGMLLVSLPDLSSLEVEARLMDVDDGRVEVGAPARCRLDASPGESYACSVAEISPVARAGSDESLRRSFRVRIALARPDPTRMRPGMSVAIEVESHRRENVLLAPRAALDLAGDPARARLRGGGETEVVLGACNALECVIESGLEEGRRLRAMGERGP